MTAQKQPSKRKKKVNTTPFTLVDKFPRSVLTEGRNWGIGFAMAKREGNVLTCVGPMSCCREYLNDQIGSEITGKPMSAYGYHATKQGLLDDESLYIIIGILPKFYCRNDIGAENYETYIGQRAEKIFLSNNFKSVQNFVNQFEELLKVPDRTVIEPISDNRYVVIIPKFWGKAAYLISLHTFILRIGLEIKFEKGDAFSAFKSSKTSDSYYISGVTQKINSMILGKYPTQTVFSHECGIVFQSFATV